MRIATPHCESAGSGVLLSTIVCPGGRGRSPPAVVRVSVPLFEDGALTSNVCEL